MNSTDLQSNQSASGPQGFAAKTLAQIIDTLGPVKQHLLDPEVNEVAINGPDDVYITRRGQERRLNVALPKQSINSAIQLIAGYVKKEVGEQRGNLLLSARLPGMRIEASLPPVSVRGPSMSIRKHAGRVFTLQEQIAAGVMTEAQGEMLQKAVDAKEAILIAGGTASGKTTLMNTTLSLIPRDQRLVVIEIVHELMIAAEHNHVLLECDPMQGITPRDAVMTAMRRNPKRVIMGELRGAEAFDWLDADNTGHPGGIATIHANDAKRVYPRLENQVLMADMGLPYAAIKSRIGETLKWCFYIEHTPAGRKVSQITYCHGYDRDRDVYEIETL